MIDLHLHTTASDGRYGPAELVERARAAGITTISITDHDTVAAVGEAARLAAALGLGFVPGIEITAVVGETDVHVLGYFIDNLAPVLERFLAGQRADRVDRVRRIAARLVRLGLVIDVDAFVRPALEDPQRSVGRPQVARALVAAGHVRDTDEAFSRWLGEGQAAYVPRRSVPPRDVVRIVAGAGGIASLAHPGLLGRDDLIPELVDEGLAGVEAYHPDHSREQIGHYLQVARRYGLGVSGGSDYHGDSAHGATSLGTIGLSAEEFEDLRARAERARAGA